MKLEFLRKWVFANALIMTSLQVQGGGWSSGGGELLRDQINPWFLNNVKQVNYCIEIDQTNFGQTKDQVRPRIINAIEFWRLNFRDLKYYLRNDQGPLIQLDNLVFTETNCTESTDLRFQFGVLSSEQKERLPNVRDFIGLTIRTDYDMKNLRGKGFIYIAPQAGPLKPTSTAIMENFWSVESGSLLFPVLIHELGHVFGIQHNNTVTMMDEGFIENILQKQNLQQFPTRNFYEEFESIDWKVTRVFKFSTQFGELLKYSFCSEASEPMPIPVEPIPSPTPVLPVKPEHAPTLRSQFFSRLPFSKAPVLYNKDRKIKSFTSFPQRPIPPLQQLLGIPEKESNCFNWGIENNKFFAKYRKSSDVPWIIAGEMDLEKPWFEDYLGTNDIVRLWLPEGQSVVPIEPYHPTNSRTTIAAGYQQVVFKGHYISTDGKQNHRLVITANPGYIKSIGGVVDGEVYYDLQSAF